MHMSAMHRCYLLPEKLYTSLQQYSFGTMHGNPALFKQFPKCKLFVHLLLCSIQMLYGLHEQLYTALEYDAAATVQGDPAMFEQYHMASVCFMRTQ